MRDRLNVNAKDAGNYMALVVKLFLCESDEF